MGAHAERADLEWLHDRRLGQALHHTIYLRGPTFSTVISQQPSHGTVRVGEIGHVVYTSRAGYVGSDAFTYVRSGRGTRGGPYVRTVQVAVTVTP